MQVMLQDPGSDVLVAAEVLKATSELLRVAKTSWLHEFEHRRNDGQSDEDFLWWKLTMQVRETSQAEPPGFVVLQQREVQGVLLLDETPACSKLVPEHKVLYLRYLATAPWNRRGQRSAPRFHRVGTALLAAAVEASLGAVSGGRIGLHALRGAEGYYLHCGLRDFGADPLHRGLHYFEGDMFAHVSSAQPPSESGVLTVPLTVGAASESSRCSSD